MSKSARIFIVIAYAMVISGTIDPVIDFKLLRDLSAEIHHTGNQLEVQSGFIDLDNELILREMPAEILYRTGHQLQIQCGTVVSSHDIEYTWNKNGKTFDLKNSSYATQNEKDGTITFREPTEDTEGIYQCFAKTSLGTASSREVHVRRAFIDYPKVIRQTHKPELGKPYKLDCNIPDGYPNPTIEWVKNKPDGNAEIILDLRITTGPDGALYFTNITSEDASSDKYVCRGRSPAVEKAVVLAKHVIEKVVPGNVNNSELVPLYLSHDMVAKAGDVTRICCIYGGTPIAHPDWFFGDKNVNNEPNDRVTRYNHSAGKCLLIKETYLEDQGTYTCKVNNEIGRPQQHSLDLTVVSAPEFLIKPPPLISADYGDQVIFPCQVTGVETPTVTWTYNAKPLTNKDKVQMEENNKFTEKLIMIVQKNDTGYYGCRAVNKYGDIYAETLVDVIY